MVPKTPDELSLAKRKTPPFYWPDAGVLMQMFLAGAVVYMVIYILHALLENKVTLEQAQRDLLMILFGIILGCFKDVYGYTFGSSAGQKRQGEVITKSLEDKDKIIADNVVTTAALAAAPSSDALKAASVVAPAAAAVAAPPAAEEAAPAAAKAAVADALADQGVAPTVKPKE